MVDADPVNASGIRVLAEFKSGKGRVNEQRQHDDRHADPPIASRYHFRAPY